MASFSDISEIIRRFLRGEMSEGESESFRQRLEHDPDLREDVEFSRLLMKGLAEAEDRKRRKRKPRYGLFLAGIVLLLVLGGAGYFLVKPEEVPEKADIVLPGVSQGAGSSIQGSDIKIGRSGNLYITGQFQGQIDFGNAYLDSPKNIDIFIASVSPELSVRWARQIGGPDGQDVAYKAVVDSEENLVITGAFSLTADFGGASFEARGREDWSNGDFFIAQYNEKGRFNWIKHGGGKLIPDKQTGENLGTAIAIDGDDHIFAAGTYVGSPEFGGDTLPVGGPGNELYLTRLTSAGDILWVKAITCNYMLSAYHMDATPDGDIFLGGYFGHHNYGGWADFEGQIVNSLGGRDIFVAKYGRDGSLRWVRTAGSANSNGRDYARGLAADREGNCIVTGYFEGEATFGDEVILTSRGTRDMFLAKYDGDGRLLWIRQMGGEGRLEAGEDVDVDPDGNIYLTGTFNGSADFGDLTLQSSGKNDIFLAKYTPEGDLIWARSFGGDSSLEYSDIGAGLVVDEDGFCYITGRFQGAVAFDEFTLQSRGQTDLFIAKVDSEGKVLGVQRVVFVV